KPTRGAETALAPGGVVEAGHPLQVGSHHLLEHELGNPVCTVHLKRLVRSVAKDDTYFASIPSVDGARGVQNSDAVLSGESGTGMNETRVTLGFQRSSQHSWSGVVVAERKYDDGQRREVLAEAA